MKALLLPILLVVIGTAAGAAAGHFLGPALGLREAAEIAAPADGANGDRDAAPEGSVAGDDQPVEYARLNNQFVVPVVAEGKVEALVVMSISLEVLQGTREAVYSVEPRLRDAFLQVLFDHANVGGFRGAFTASGPMDGLRSALHEAGEAILGPTVLDVLIVDIVRQDIG